MSIFKPAVRTRIKLRAAIDGPTGGGKTYTALELARIIAGPDGAIGIIDTESESALRYALAPGEEAERRRFYDFPFEFGHLPQRAPYDPRELSRLIMDAGAELGPDGVLIVDSATHYWNGEGGTLAIVEDAEDRARGNRFAAWREGTPAQRMMLGSFLDCPCHIIVCMRSVMSYELQEKVVDGRTVKTVEKMGLKPEQRGGIEYEFDLVVSMDQAHTAKVTKSRIRDVADRVLVVGESWKLGESLAAWLQTGAQRIDQVQAAAITAMFDAIEDDDTRKEIKLAFVREFGAPADMLADRVEAAYTWISEAVSPAQGELTSEPEGDDESAPAVPDLPDNPEFDVDPEPDTADPVPEPEAEAVPDGPGSPESDAEAPSAPRARKKLGKRPTDAQEPDPEPDGPVRVSGKLADAIGGDS